MKSFYRVWDPASCAQVCESIDRGRGGPILHAEGGSFRCYRLPQGDQEGLETVLLLGKESQLRQRTVQSGEWQRAMEALGRMQHPLLPPFQLLKGRLAYVMPYCAKELPKSWQENPLFRTWVQDLLKELAAVGLILDDVWQFRLWQGHHPLLTDFSDLRFRD